jgi:hypothetical protein
MIDADIDGDARSFRPTGSRILGTVIIAGTIMPTLWAILALVSQQI